ncbi:asparagine synthetase A [Streptomyces sp. NPDC098077]|uniref:asparagine synthetase A n=1 Tax=Streptomyces sp. NPDC098077 TaxID=3366093 RepID=UPI0037F7F350
MERASRDAGTGTFVADALVVPPPPSVHLASDTTRAALRVQHRLLMRVRAFLDEQGFVEIQLPVVGPVTDPGIRGSKQIDVDYYGHRYKLMTSGIFYKQAAMLALKKIYYVAPNVRMEPVETADTNRHLAEFHQIDLEWSGATREDVMQVVESMLRRVLPQVAEDSRSDFEILERDIGEFLARVERPFATVAHSDAVADLRRLGHGQSADAEIDWEGEAILSGRSGSLFFITDYPKGSRGFYDREDPDCEGILRNFDLLAPEGYGELASGSEREYVYETLISRMRETGENPGKYRWYLDLAREGIPASAGCGLGVERLTRFVTGLDAVWRAVAFPKLPGVAAP